jgi:hypothetical protein
MIREDKGTSKRLPEASASAEVPAGKKNAAPARSRPKNRKAKPEVFPVGSSSAEAFASEVGASVCVASCV